MNILNLQAEPMTAGDFFGARGQDLPPGVGADDDGYCVTSLNPGRHGGRFQSWTAKAEYEAEMERRRANAAAQ